MFFIGIIILLINFGITALVWGLLFDAFIITSLYITFASKVFTYKLKDQLIDVLPVTIITLFTIILMIIIKSFFQNSYLQLIVAPVIGISFYILMGYIFKRDNLLEVLKLIKIRK